MAYGIKYSGSGQGLDGLTYTVEILRDGYGGSPTSIVLDKPAAVVRWGQRGADVYEPVRASFAEVLLFDKAGTIKGEIFNADDSLFRMRIKQGSNVYWFGKMVTDIYEGSLNLKPEKSRIAAFDGLGQLEDIGFEAETRVSLVQAIADILADVGLELNIRLACNWFTPDIQSSEDPCAKINVEQNALWGDDDAQVSSMDALKQILERHGLQLHQSHNVWWVVQRELLNETSYDYYEYDKTGAYVGKYVHEPAVTIDESTQYGRRLADGRLNYRAAYKTTTVTYFPKPDSGVLIPNGGFETWADPDQMPDGWTKSDVDLVVSRTGLAMEGSFSAVLAAWEGSYRDEWPPFYIECIGGIVSGAVMALKIRLMVRASKNNATPPLPTIEQNRKCYFSIYYGDYFLKRVLNGTLSWVLISEGAPFEDHILFKNAGVSLFGEIETDEITTPNLPQAVGELKVRLWQLVEFEYYSGQPYYDGVVYDAFTIESLVVGEATAVVEGTRTVTQSIVLPNTQNRDTIEFSIGDGPSSLTPSRLTVGSTTLTGNWKRGPYSGQDPTGKSIDAILAETWMRAQKTPLEIHEAVYIKRANAGYLIEAHNPIAIGSKRYAFVYLERDLLAAHSAGEWVEIKAEDSDLLTTVEAITKDSGTNRERRNTQFGDNTNVGSETFASGFAGSGWGIRKENGKYILTIDGIVVRGFLSAYEFLIQQVRAHNGTLFVTDTGSGKIEDYIFLDGTGESEAEFENL